MPARLIAIDPGTHLMGIALFDGPELVACHLLTADPREPAEVRIAQLIAQLEDLAVHHPEIREAACERTAAIEGRRPAPELQTIIRRLRQWARQRPRRWQWTDHHPSRVLASVRPKDASARSKEIVKLGVRLLYGHQLNVDDTDQNVIDAVAIGHCHTVSLPPPTILTTTGNTEKETQNQSQNSRGRT